MKKNIYSSKGIILILILISSYILASVIIFDKTIYIPSINNREYISLNQEYIKDNSESFKIDKNSFTWVFIDNLQFKPNYIDIYIKNLDKQGDIKIYYGLNNNFEESKTLTDKLKNGRNIIKFYDNDGFNSLRLDLVGQKNILANIEKINIGTHLNYNATFILLTVLIAILLVFLYKNINNIIIVIDIFKNNILNMNQYYLFIFKIAIILLSLFYILKYWNSNQYNILILIIGIYFSIYICINRIKNDRKIFFVLSLALGILFSVLLPPMQGPDEDVHLIRSYYLSDGNFKYASKMYIPKSIKNYLEDINAYSMPANYDEKVNKEMYKNKKNEKLDKEKVIEINDNSRTKSYLIFAYLPQALGMFFAKMMNLSPFYIILLGRISNLLIWIFMCDLAIKFVPFNKKILMITMLLPMSLHQAASLSPDAILNASSFLLISYILKLRFMDRKNRWTDLVFISVLSIFIVSVKLPYIIILLALFIIPKEKFNLDETNSKILILKKYMFILTPMLISLLFYYLNIKFMVDYSKINEISKGILNTTIITSIICNIGHYFKVVFNTLIQNKFFIHSIVGVFGSLDTPIPLELVYFTTMVIIIYSFNVNTINFRKERNILLSLYFFIILILVVVFIQASSTGGFVTLNVDINNDMLWLSTNIVSGIQGRYFIPFIIMLIFFNYNNKVYLLNKEIDYYIANYLLNNNIALIYSISILILINRYWII